MRRHLISFVTAAVLVTVLVLYLVTYRVRFSEVAVLTTFSSITGVKTDPGSYWKWPWPVQKVYRYDRRVQVFQSPLVECVTNDKKTIIVSVAVGWRVSDAERFHRGVKTVDNARQILVAQANSDLHVVGRHPLAHFISSNEGDLQFDQIEEEMRRLINQTASAEFGAHIEFVRIVHLALPEKATEAVFKRMREEHENLASQYRTEGRSQAQIIREQANQERDRMLAVARGNAERIKGEGDAEAAEHYRVFAQHPELAIFLAELKALEEVKPRTTVILDTRTPPYNLLETRPEELRIRQGEPQTGKETK